MALAQQRRSQSGVRRRTWTAGRRLRIVEKRARGYNVHATGMIVPFLPVQVTRIGKPYLHPRWAQHPRTLGARVRVGLRRNSCRVSSGAVRQRQGAKDVGSDQQECWNH